MSIAEKVLSAPTLSSPSARGYAVPRPLLYIAETSSAINVLLNTLMSSITPFIFSEPPPKLPICKSWASVQVPSTLMDVFVSANEPLIYNFCSAAPLSTV